MGNGFVEPSAKEVQSLLGAMVGRRLAVIGDVMLDAYLFGRVGRTSVEAPVPIVAVEREEFLLGGAANVAKCLAALGAGVRVCGVIGADEHGEMLLKEARGLSVDVSAVLTDRSRPTTFKRRVIAQRQQMLRMDYESAAALDEGVERRLRPRALHAVARAEAVLLSDYAKGVLGPALCRAIIHAAGPRPVVVDPKAPPWDHFAGATVFKPNSRAAGLFVGREVKGDAEAAHAAREVLRRVKVRHVVLTRGEEGLTVASRSAQGRATVWRLPARRHEVADPTGAGDVVAATLGLALAAGADMRCAAWIANVAAGVKVGKLGAAPVSQQEILQALGHGPLECEQKLLDRVQAAAFAAKLHRQRRRVIFTNGCFDILHFGHVSLLQRARRLGDALIVGLNTDAGVRRLKGPGRPIQNQHDRARILAAQACVDAVVFFDEDTPHALIRAIRPDVLCKGADYRRKQNVVGWHEVENWGGRVVLIPLEAGRSTSAILQRQGLGGRD
jgi:D-beta-D-heptose 7-phosphate kinase/D-beta-D-heptose 1-phosphate adenosyltransferase